MSEQNNAEKEEALKAKLSADLNSKMAALATGVAPLKIEFIPEVKPDISKEVHDEEKIVSEEETNFDESPIEVKDEKPFISETFQKLVSNPVPNSSTDDIRPASILSGITVDLNNIEINDTASNLELIQNEKVVFDSKKVMQVVCCQSAYSAEMSALKSQEIQNISDTNVDFYNYKKRLYKALWTHIENSSVGKMDFATWMKVTSYFDVETLLYGAYCQTFPYENKYSLRCPKSDCKHAFDIVVNNTTLIETRGREAEIFAKINEVIANVNLAKDLLSKSLVHTTKRVSVDETKIIFDLHIPSVFDYLEGILSDVNEDFAEEYATTLGIGLFVKQILVPDVLGYKDTGKLTYIPITEKDKIIDLISNLPYYDGLQIAEEINEFTGKYQISYSIKGISCPACGHEMSDIPMGMEDVLFTVIRQGRRGKKEQKAISNT